ncbi:hypothetical protein [Wolbachia endosymbiont of Trichogramma pretiosum]|uniref:hypothetical protein n=1 Tax=Wolbachia endosymbiont of Trichogramma pretiosum TaxID=125593 RepID=UPI000838A2D3|nr:hypothetical protein [Wolbachia endosymbiont of Trichogramma pretiosum]OCA06805.1 hypothetical protein wTpre_1152 [Wolbachia endosymbiont of Trichogramma pretiosum]
MFHRSKRRAQEKQTEIKTKAICGKNSEKEIKEKKQYFTNLRNYSISHSIPKKLTSLANNFSLICG